MSDTKVRFDGIDESAIADYTDARAGSAVDKLMNPDTTREAIDHFLQNLSTSTIGLAKETFRPFSSSAGNPTTHISVNTTPIALDDGTNLTAASTFTKTLSNVFTEGDNQGGLDTGAKGPNLTYYVWIIGNSSDNIDALFSLSATSPTMPSGYTRKRRVGAVYTDGSSDITSYVVIHDASVYSVAADMFVLLEYDTANTFANYIIKSGNVFDDLNTDSFLFDDVGNFTASGDVTAFSDARLKHDVETIDDALGKIEKIRGVKYKKHLDTRQRLGVIAQEIEEVLPELVLTHNDGMKSVAYDKLTAVLIEAVKTLSDRVDYLEDAVSDIEERE